MSGGAAEGAGGACGHGGQAANTADSAGTPWKGRDLKPNPFSGDTGEPDEGLLAALTAAAQSPLDAEAHVGVVRALAGVRLYAPILPAVLEQEVGADGLMHDNSSEMAMVRLASSDGRQCTPAFTGIPALTAWHEKARPVPIEAERLGAAAVEEGAELVIVDPGTPHAFLLRRPALWSFLRQLPWRPCWDDAELAAAVARTVGGVDWIAGAAIGPGSAGVLTSGPELRIDLRVERRPEQAELAEVQRRLAACDEVVERVDSMGITLQGA